MLFRMQILRLFAILVLGVVSVPAQAAPGQCEHPEIDRSGLVSDVMFNVDIAPYGGVCFVARQTTYSAEFSWMNNYIEFELLQNGKLVYTLPRPKRFLWIGGCRVLAVGFPKLGADERRSVIVLGLCPTARDELLQPLIYLPDGDGFKVDIDLSDKTAGLDTIAKVIHKVKKLLAHPDKR